MSARAAAAAADAEKKAAVAAAAAKQAALAASAEHKARLLKAKIDADAGWDERLPCASASNLMEGAPDPFFSGSQTQKGSFGKRIQRQLDAAQDAEGQGAARWRHEPGGGGGDGADVSAAQPIANVHALYALIPTSRDTGCPL